MNNRLFGRAAAVLTYLAIGQSTSVIHYRFMKRDRDNSTIIGYFWPVTLPFMGYSHILYQIYDKIDDKK